MFTLKEIYSEEDFAESWCEMNIEQLPHQWLTTALMGVTRDNEGLVLHSSQSCIYFLYHYSSKNSLCINMLDLASFLVTFIGKRLWALTLDPLKTREKKSLHTQQPVCAGVSKSGLAQGIALCKLSEIRPPASVDTRWGEVESRTLGQCFSLMGHRLKQLHAIIECLSEPTWNVKSCW